MVIFTNLHNQTSSLNNISAYIKEFGVTSVSIPRRTNNKVVRRYHSLEDSSSTEVN